METKKKDRFVIVFDVSNTNKICGIYCIKNKVNSKVYIGKGFNARKRIMEHLSDLKRNAHVNKHLQSSYNKYGANNFEIYLLEKLPSDTSPEDLIIREQYWIDECDKNLIYNKILDVINHNGNSFLNKNHSEETRTKMSLAKVGKYFGSNNPNFGKKASLQTRVKMATKNSQTKLTVNEVLEIKNLLIEGKLNDFEIATKFKISRGAVTRIANGTRWSNITGGRVIKEERRGKRNIGRHRSLETKIKISNALKNKAKEA